MPAQFPLLARLVVLEGADEVGVETVVVCELEETLEVGAEDPPFSASLTDISKRSFAGLESVIR